MESLYSSKVLDVFLTKIFADSVVLVMILSVMVCLLYVVYV